MKTIILKTIVGFFILFFTLSANAVSLSSFNGEWKNVDKNTRGITKISLSTRGSQVSIRAFGSCSPKDCDWGKVKAYPYAKSTSSNVKTATKALTASYKTGFSETFLVLKLTRNRLTVESFTRFTDRSGRSNYNNRYTFTRNYISTPKQLSPRNNQVFNVYPRTTVLTWSKVQDAKYYGVEVDCLHCCEKNKWCIDVKNKAWKVATKLTSPTYTFNYVGAQKGKWRVWAIDKNGKRSPKSPWRTFEYSR